VAELTGVRELGRRMRNGAAISLTFDGQAYELPAAQWLTPFDSGGDSVLGSISDGPLAVDLAVGKGRVILCGGYLGDAYYDGASLGNAEFGPHCGDFERFVARLARRAGARPTVEVFDSALASGGRVHIKLGRSGERRVCFVFFGEGCQSARLRFPSGTFLGKARDLISGGSVHLTVTMGGEEVDVTRPEWGLMVLVQEL
jgi:hypothetical protein